MHYDPPRMFKNPVLRKISFCAASLASGWIAAFAMSPASFWPCLFVGLSALYYLFSCTEKPMQAYAAGFFFGIGYFTTGLWWIGNALLVEGNEFAWVWPISVIGLPTLLSLFTGLYLSIARIVATPNTVKGFFAFAFFLTLSEWTRGTAFTGFPWNLYGYVWAEHLPMAQSFHYFGAYGMTFLSVVWAAAAGFLYVWDQDKLPKILCIAAVGGMMSIMNLVGAARLDNNPTAFDTANAVVVVQPNIPQNMKWDPTATQTNFVKTVQLSEVPESIFGESVPENVFIVWPETAISPAVSDLAQNVDMLRGMLRSYNDTNAFLVTGILRRKPDLVERDGVMETAYGNSVALIDKDLSNIHFYDKYNLVPFGEFIPFQKWIPLKPVAAFRGFEAGGGPARMEAGGMSKAPAFSPLICYEVIFPDIVTDRYAKRPDWIVNVTNDGWYGDSAGPHQHFAQTRLRAIEEGLPVIRSANTGISGVIDPYGRIVKEAKIFEEAALTSYLPSPLPRKNPYWPWAVQIIMPLIGLFLMIGRLLCKKQITPTL